MERTQVKSKLWLVNDRDEPIMGEGKVSLLEAVREEGSLNKACKKVHISYKHAWLLLNEIEESVGEPVIIKKRGGKDRGTILTEKGIDLIDQFTAYQNILDQTIYDNTFWEAIGLKISARNQIKGKVQDIEQGDLVARVKVRIEPASVTALITAEAAKALDIKKNDTVTVIVKATEVMIGKG